MFESLREAKKLAYRRLKYWLRKPKPPADPGLAGSHVVIVGSAPVSHKPEGFDDTYKVISINGSQGVMAAWPRETPDITLMQFNQIEGENTNAVEVRRVLRGRRTGTLYVLLWRHGRERLEKGLKAFDYRYGDLRIVDRYERIALMEKVSNVRNFELDAETKCSNGLIGVLFALHSGARAVIITGINPDSGGHVYNDVNLARMHVSKDKEMLQILLRGGYLVFTADPDVSKSTGVPLWTGKA
ncbi:MAG: membrane-anchored protein [Shinella sp.]|nr:membrane-anchored protein [Shinella sp.]